MAKVPKGTGQLSLTMPDHQNRPYGTHGPLPRHTDPGKTPSAAPVAHTIRIFSLAKDLLAVRPPWLAPIGVHGTKHRASTTTASLGGTPTTSPSRANAPLGVWRARRVQAMEPLFAGSWVAPVPERGRDEVPVAEASLLFQRS